MSVIKYRIFVARNSEGESQSNTELDQLIAKLEPKGFSLVNDIDIANWVLFEKTDHFQKELHTDNGLSLNKNVFNAILRRKCKVILRERLEELANSFTENQTLSDESLFLIGLVFHIHMDSTEHYSNMITSVGGTVIEEFTPHAILIAKDPINDFKDDKKEMIKKHSSIVLPEEWLIKVYEDYELIEMSKEPVISRRIPFYLATDDQLKDHHVLIQEDAREMEQAISTQIEKFGGKVTTDVLQADSVLCKYESFCLSGDRIRTIACWNQRIKDGQPHKTCPDTHLPIYVSEPWLRHFQGQTLVVLGEETSQNKKAAAGIIRMGALKGNIEEHVDIFLVDKLTLSKAFPLYLRVKRNKIKPPQIYYTKITEKLINGDPANSQKIKEECAISYSELKSFIKKENPKLQKERTNQDSRKRNQVQEINSSLNTTVQIEELKESNEQSETPNTEKQPNYSQAVRQSGPKLQKISTNNDTENTVKDNPEKTDQKAHQLPGTSLQLHKNRTMLNPFKPVVDVNKKDNLFYQRYNTKQTCDQIYKTISEVINQMQTIAAHSLTKGKVIADYLADPILHIVRNFHSLDQMRIWRKHYVTHFIHSLKKLGIEPTLIYQGDKFVFTLPLGSDGNTGCAAMDFAKIENLFELRISIFKQLFICTMRAKILKSCMMPLQFGVICDNPFPGCPCSKFLHNGSLRTAETVEKSRDKFQVLPALLLNCKRNTSTNSQCHIMEYYCGGKEPIFVTTEAVSDISLHLNARDAKVPPISCTDDVICRDCFINKFHSDMDMIVSNTFTVYSQPDEQKTCSVPQCTYNCSTFYLLSKKISSFTRT